MPGHPPVKEERDMRGQSRRLEPDPVIEVYKKDVDRTLIRESLRRSVRDRRAQR